MLLPGSTKFSRALARFRLFFFSCFVFAYACGAPTAYAQGRILPREASAREGNAISTHLGFDQVRFVQSIGAALLPDACVVSEIAWRRDGEYASGQTIRYEWWHKQNAHSVRIDLAPLDPDSRLTGAFPSKAERVRAFRRSSLVLPDLTWRDRATQAFDVRFKLDAPFAYRGEGLAIDVTVDHPRWNDWTPYALDAVRRARPELHTEHYGHGPLRLFVTHGSAVRLHCFGGSPGLPVLFALGSRPLSGPLYVDPELIYLRSANTSGSAELELPFVSATRVYAQAWQFTPEPLWSPGVEVTTGRAPLDAWIVQALGHQKAWSHGFVEENTLLVTELR